RMANEDKFMMFLAKCVLLVSIIVKYLGIGPKERVHRSILIGAEFIKDLIEGHSRGCYDLLCMNVGCFLQLADEMKTRGLLTDSRMVRVEEQLAIFEFTLAHSERDRVVQNRFQHSGETISYYFNKCLKACLRLEKYYVKQARKGVPQQISSNPLFYPWFKDCIGAIDGTHIPAFVSMEDQPRYRNRKGVLYQNVLAVVDFDINFQYVLVGWEGSASDSRVLRNAVWEKSSNKLKIPTGNLQIIHIPIHFYYLLLNISFVLVTL
ncbi:hypothetical protein A4A49_52422, partial [Nicotiana attenuata]